MSSRGLVAVALLVASCSQRVDRPAPHAAELPEGVVARVGDLVVPDESVRRIASAQGISPANALDRAVKDALFAAFVRATGDPAAVEVATRSAYARSLIEQLEKTARAAGPPSDAEVQALTQERWAEVDRPPTARTTHVVVRVKKAEDDARAKALAERLASELATVEDPTEFVKRAKATASGDLEIRAERLPAVALDGRIYYPEGAPPSQGDTRFDLDFARAALALERPGEHSPVTKSAFGYHVILLEERFPEERVPFEERRQLFAEDVVTRRAKQALQQLLEELRQSAMVEVSRSADELTSQVPVAP